MIGEDYQTDRIDNMSSRSMDQDMFYPPAHHQYDDQDAEFIGPAEEVDVLLLAARDVRSLDEALLIMLSEHRDLFFDVFGRQINLLKSRSQAFEDAHITVYDKILLELTDNGNDLDNAAAITWYCTEYLGYNPHDEHDDGMQALERAIALPTLLDSAVAASKLANAGPENEVIIPLDEDEKFQRLWSLYQTALSDYLAVAGDRSLETLATAKFLRDTAENAITYVKTHFFKVESAGQEVDHNDQATLRGLENTYEIGKNMVVALNGGKKRKFDYIADRAKGFNAPRKKRDAPPAEDVAEDVGGSRSPDRDSRTYYDRQDRQDREHDRRGRGYDRQGYERERSRNRSRNRNREQDRERGRDLFHDRLRERERDYEEDGRRSAKRADEARRWYERRHPGERPPTGRGHSSVPYGYSGGRSVDSYQPHRSR